MKKIMFSKEQEEEIINFYKKEYSIKYISNIFKVSSGTISKFLKRKKIDIVNKSQFKKIYSLNENFFEKIDTEEKAYFLGFLYSDGYIYPKKNSVSLCLQIEDIEILNKFNTCISSNRPLYRIKPPKKFPYRKVLVKLNIVNNQFFKHLISKGCLNKKSLILKFPNKSIIKKDLLHHFIRGYFDGDGSVYISSNKLNIEFTGTLNFITEVQNILIKDLGFNKTSIYFKKNAKNTCRVRYTGNKQCLKFKNWLYKNSTVFLDRKKSKFEEIASV